MERARYGRETPGNGNFLTRTTNTIAGTAKVTAAAVALFLGAENKANAQFPPWWPPAPPSPSWRNGAVGESERLPPLNEKVTSVKQHSFTELPSLEGDVFIEKLRRDFRPKMNDEKFMTRERASNTAWTELHALTRRMNPPSGDVLKALNLSRKDAESLEVFKRVENLRNCMYNDESVAFGPTRVPIEDGERAPETLRKLTARSATEIRFAHPEAQEKLTDIELLRGHNTFAEIIREIGNNTGTVPDIVRTEQNVIEMKKAETGQCILIDESGVLIGVFSPEQGEGKKRTPPRLDVIADPSRALIELVSAQHGENTADVTVRIHPAISPLWHTLEGFQQPRVEATARLDGNLQPGLNELALRVGTLGVPTTRTLPADTGIDGATFGPQFMRMERNPETGDITVNMLHENRDIPGVYWMEAQAITPQWTLCDERGSPIPTTVTGLTHSAGAHLYSATLQGEEGRKPHAVAVRAYAHQDDYDEKAHLPPFRFTLPRSASPAAKLP